MIGIISMFVLLVIVLLGLFWLKKTLFIFGFFFKFFMLLMLVAIVGSVVFGYMIVKDANDFRNHFSNSTNVFIVKDTVNETTTFLSGTTLNLTRKSDAYAPMDKDQLSSIKKLYDEDKMSTLNAQYYKMFVIDLKAFDDMKAFNVTDFKISDQNIELNHSEVSQVMLSSDARSEVAEIIALRNNVSKSSVLKEINFDDEQIKAYILSYYLTSTLSPQNIAGLLSQLKNGNIQVYEETALFKSVKFIPQSLIDLVVNF